MTAPLTPEALEDLRKKAEAAHAQQPSPWTNDAIDSPGRWNHGRCEQITDVSGRPVVQTDGGHYPPEPAAAHFIAAANPATVLALLDRIASLEGALGDISTACETKDLRYGSPADLADKQRGVIESVWKMARRAYDGTL